MAIEATKGAASSRLRRMKRGGLLATAVVGAVALLAGCASATDSSASGDEQVTLAISVRDVSGAYHAAWVEGGRAFADSIGAKLEVLVSGDDSQNQLSQIQSLIAGSSGKVIINMDPNTPSILQATVKAVEQNENAYLVAQWNKPAEITPWDTSERWVSFINYDGVDAGYQTAKALFDEMNGTGGVVAIQGILDNIASQQRYEGFEKALAEYPGITLLGSQPADWDQAQALNVMKTFIAKDRDTIGGVWVADDGMAIGAASALSAAGLDVAVASAAGGTPEAFDMIKAGSGVIATTDPDPYWQGGIGLALGYYAATGQLDVAAMTKEQRSFNASQALVLNDNVADYIAGNTPEKYLEAFQLDNLFDRITGPAK